MKNLFLFITTALLFFILGFFARNILIKEDQENNLTFLTTDEVKEKLFERYAIEVLANTDIKPGKFEIGKSLKKEEEFESFLFTYEFNPNLDGKTLKKITGQINLPIPEDLEYLGAKHPVILMFRGYINQETYQTGDGTRNASEYFAENEFITIAPDFLGYGASDLEAENIFETRFQTYVTAVSLIKTLEHLKTNPNLLSAFDQLTNQLINHSSIFLWGHSNGGQIVLTALEITSANYPTTLWAPVTKPFPYSVLYYTDQSEDHGKLIRNELARFEKDYDVEKYSLTNYLDKIKAPIHIHQGTTDDAIPQSWSDTFVNLLRASDVNVIYYTYPDTDHNMRPNWDIVIERDLKFFQRFLKD